MNLFYCYDIIARRMSFQLKQLTYPLRSGSCKGKNLAKIRSYGEPPGSHFLFNMDEKKCCVEVNYQKNLKGVSVLVFKTI
jgi:hypothetical protein